MQNISLRDTMLYPSTIHRAVECFASFGSRRYTVVSEDSGITVEQAEDRSFLSEMALRVAQVVLFPLTLVVLIVKALWRSENKEKELKSIAEVQDVFKSIPLSKNKEFLGTISSVYQKCIKEKLSPESALIEALSEGLSTAIQLELVEEDYTCAIGLDFVGLDPVYLQKNKEGRPCQIYHRKPLEEWIRNKGTDPYNRNQVRLSDIKNATEIAGEIKKIYPRWTHALTNGALASFPDTSSNNSLLQAALKAYSIAKEVYRKALQLSKEDNKVAVAAAKKTMIDAVNLLEGLAKGGVDISQITTSNLQELLCV